MITLSTKRNQFYLDVHGKTMPMNFCELLALRSKLQNIDITDHFYSDRNSAGLEIISLCNLKHILILETLDLINLKEIIDNAFHYQDLSLSY